MTEHRAHESTITITAAGAPGTCPHCGTACGAWPLTVYGGQVQASCPHCYTAIARVEVTGP